MSIAPHQIGSPSAGHRRKTTEACNPCRARKSKCNGLLPCQSCEKNGVACAYDSSTGTSKFSQGLDILNVRVLELERAVFGEGTYQHPGKADRAVTHTANHKPSYVSLHGENSSFGFYGPTSTMVLLKEVQSKLPRADSAESNDCGSPRKRPRREVLDDSNPGSGLPNTPNCDIPTATPSQQAVHGNLQLREYFATAHLDCFFLSVHNTLPVLDEAAFRGSYNSFWTDSTQSEPWQCLLYAVLALGALRSKATENPAEWATKYFDQAQDLLSGILGLSCIETVQAAMFMAIYAHTIDSPNAAYNYLGIAIRTAYSIGINRNLEAMSSEAVADLQSARRTWWMLYSLESDLCIEYGKPLSIRERDAKAASPLELPPVTSTTTTNVDKLVFITASAKFSRISRKIIDLISDISETNRPIQSFVGRLMNHQAELMTWRGELPAHLAPRESASTKEVSSENDEAPWIQSQRCGLELRFNNQMLVIHRPFYASVEFTTPFYTSNMARSVCLGAACETISTIQRALDGNNNKGTGIDYCSRYYHRALAASLVLLNNAMDLTEDAKGKASLAQLCSTCMEIFLRMNPVCSKAAIALLQSILQSL